jgi:putative aldouronate transport system substrate-binding protein
MEGKAMHKTKTLVCLFTVMVFTLGALLNGCAQSPTPAATSAATVAATVAPAETPAAPTQEPLKQVALKYYLPASTFTDQAMTAVQDAVNKYLTDKLNCTLELGYLTWDQWGTKYPVILSSGDQADLMFTAQWSGFSTGIANGSFTELTDLLKQYGQGIQANIQDGFIKAATVKGKLYAIPENKDAAQGYGLYLDPTVLDKAGVKLADLKSLDDLTPVLAYIKANMPDMIPLPITLNGGGIFNCTKTGIAEGVGDNSTKEFGYDDQMGVIDFDSKADKFIIVDPSTSQIWPAYAQLMSQWFKAGYFRPDITTDTTDTSVGLLKDGKSWMTYSSDAPGQLESISLQANKTLVYMPLLPDICNTGSMTGSLTAIPVSSVDPARAMMVLNLMHTDGTLVNLLTNGIEGKNYVKTGDSTIKLPEGFKNKGDTGWDPGLWWEVGNAFLGYVWDTDLQDRWTKVKAYNDAAPRSPLLGFMFDKSKVTTEFVAVNNIYQQFDPLIITGQGDTADYVNQMFTQMKTAGLDKIVDEFNVQYQAYKAAQ